MKKIRREGRWVGRIGKVIDYIFFIIIVFTRILFREEFYFF